MKDAVTVRSMEGTPLQDRLSEPTVNLADASRKLFARRGSPLTSCPVEKAFLVFIVGAGDQDFAASEVNDSGAVCACLVRDAESVCRDWADAFIRQVDIL